MTRKTTGKDRKLKLKRSGVRKLSDSENAQVGGGRSFVQHQQGSGACTTGDGCDTDGCGGPVQTDVCGPNVV